MNISKLYLVNLLFFALISLKANAQCPFDPIVTGDTLLCPNTPGQLITQVYDTYQWYKRPLFGGPAQPVPGATSQTLMIDATNDAGFYFKVEATLNGCTEMSPEVLVDGWLFLLPYTIIEGDYTIGGSGELVLCQGDTIFLISGMPYDTNLQWFDGGVPIPGANNDTLIVTSAGSYTFSGAPSVCPNFIQNQFVPSDVVVITCPTGIQENPLQEISISPNPATDNIRVAFTGFEQIEIYDITGKLVLTAKTDHHASIHELDISALHSGSYTIKVYTNGMVKNGRFYKK